MVGNHSTFGSNGFRFVKPYIFPNKKQADLPLSILPRPSSFFHHTENKERHEKEFFLFLSRTSESEVQVALEEVFHFLL